MKKLDTFEEYNLTAYEKGELKSTTPSKAALAKFKDALNIRHSGLDPESSALI